MTVTCWGCASNYFGTGPTSAKEADSYLAALINTSLKDGRVRITSVQVSGMAVD